VLDQELHHVALGLLGERRFWRLALLALLALGLEVLRGLMNDSCTLGAQPAELVARVGSSVLGWAWRTQM